MNDACVMAYTDAVASVQQSLPTPRLATTVKRILACRVVDTVYGVGTGAEPKPHHEREASIHIRKMIAEGEILEEMQGKRLYYKLPTQENQ